MIASIGLAILTLRVGLRLRRKRRARQPRSPAELRRHVRLAKPTVALLGIGFVTGPASAVWLRGWGAFETVHAWVAVVAISLFAAVATLGLRLENGRGRAVEAHALLGVLAVFAAAAALGTGFVLLP